VSNACVINNTIHDLRAEYFGIYIEQSTAISIMNNTIFNLNWVGIEIIDSKTNKITNNEVYNCSYRGMRICNSNYMTVQENRIYECNVHGLSFESEQTTGFFDIKLTGSIIRNNIISQNDHSGLEISVISENTLYNNRDNGILHRYTHNMNVTKNNFIGNNFEILDNYGSLSQVYLIEDIGSVFDFNYWSDLNTSDLYNIDGEGFDYSEGEFFPVKGIAKDYHPLSNPNQLELHILSVPRVLSPNNHSIYKGELEISWTPSIDYSGHEVNYSVYIWMNHEWRLISQDVLSAKIMWDTLESDDGGDFRIKVVAICTMGLTSEDISDSSFEIQNKMKINTNIPGGGYIISLLAFIALGGLQLTRKRLI
jgi:parallel beta-helix repeat protein